jgi:hypothetical protein
MEKKIVAIEDFELVRIINNDNSLSGPENTDRKAKLLSLANIYEADFATNLGLDSLDLTSKYEQYGVTPVEWRKFLSHPSIKKFIDGFLEERMEKQAMSRLAGPDVKASDAFKIKQDMDTRNKGSDNHNIVMVFVPFKRDVGFDDGSK